MRYLFLPVFLLLTSFFFGQSVVEGKKLLNNDFKNAIEINDSIIGPSNVCMGYGDEREFSHEWGKEENSAWFKLTAEYDTLITFDLMALDSADEYDFIVFKCPSPDCIKDIKSGKVRPERFNFACNSTMHVETDYLNMDISKFSTGLSKGSKETFLAGMEHLTYTSAIRVKKGETWYIMITNCYTPKTQTRFCKNFPKGFMLYFYNYAPQKRPVILKSVLFESNKAVLLSQSYSELNKLVDRLNLNKSMKIQISGHTDNKGDETVNQKLSEDRARAVKTYLVSKGINESRISFIGMGSRKAIASNENEEGRKKNRRVEFVITSH